MPRTTEEKERLLAVKVNLNSLLPFCPCMAPKDSLKMTIKIKEIVGLLQLEFRKSQAQQESGRGDLGIDTKQQKRHKG